MWERKAGGTGGDDEGGAAMCLGCVSSGGLNIPNLSTTLVQATGEARNQGRGVKLIPKPPLRGWLKLFPLLCKILLGSGEFLPENKKAAFAGANR